MCAQRAFASAGRHRDGDGPGAWICAAAKPATNHVTHCYIKEIERFWGRQYSLVFNNYAYYMLGMKREVPNSLIFLLHDTARLLKNRFEQRRKCETLTRAQWHLTAYLARNEGITQARLADLLEVEPITVCRMVDRMEEAGWVERRADPADRRVRRLYMTDKAWGVFDQMRAIASEVSEDVLGALTPLERATFIALLERVRKNLSERPDAPASNSQPVYTSADTP